LPILYIGAHLFCAVARHATACRPSPRANGFWAWCRRQQRDYIRDGKPSGVILPRLSDQAVCGPSVLWITRRRGASSCTSEDHAVHACAVAPCLPSPHAGGDPSVVRQTQTRHEAGTQSHGSVARSRL